MHPPLPLRPRLLQLSPPHPTPLGRPAHEPTLACSTGQVRDRLNPLLVEAGPGVKPPHGYSITGHSKERPHLWVKEPLKSLVVQVGSAGWRAWLCVRE